METGAGECAAVYVVKIFRGCVVVGIYETLEYGRKCFYFPLNALLGLC